MVLSLFCRFIYLLYSHAGVIQTRFSPDGREDVVIAMSKDLLFST